MIMLKLIKICLLSIVLCFTFGCEETRLVSPKQSLIILGDIHYDRIENHDIDWLKSKPGDYRQVTEEYTVFTEKSFNRLIDEVLSQTNNYEPDIKAIIQLGDLQEGLAGTPDLARKMTIDTRDALRAKEFKVPWILVKGNHDITGPGANEAFQEIMLPFIENELNIPITNTSYSYYVGNIKVIVLDCYKLDEILSFLETELSESNAKYNVIATHQQIIPITGRCWHIFNKVKHVQEREKLLTLIAKHKAIVLNAHMHRYSVLRRMTSEGPIVQLSTISVIREEDKIEPYWYLNEYGSSLVDLEPNFDPDTKNERKNILEQEAKFVTDFHLADMPGYSILVYDDSAGTICLKAFSGLGFNLMEEMNLTDLMK